MLELETHGHAVYVEVWMCAAHEGAETDVRVRLITLRHEQGRRKVAHALTVPDGGMVQGVSGGNMKKVGDRRDGSESTWKGGSGSIPNGSIPP